MTWHAVPAVKAALAEATERWPDRNKASDGTIGDPAHSNRTSDHNPDERGHVLAFDLTCDLDNGCDAHKLVREAVARGDKRIKYAISERQIWSHARRKEGWRPYSGPNPHETHAHVSVERRYENDTSPWWAIPEPPITPLEEAVRTIIYAPGRATCLLCGDGTLYPLASNSEKDAYVAAGWQIKGLSAEQFDTIDAVSKRIWALR